MSKRDRTSEAKPSNGPDFPWLGMDGEAISTDLSRHFHLTLGRDANKERHHYLYNAAALTVRDRLVQRWRQTRQRHKQSGSKQVAYISMEFLMGRALTNAVLNLDMESSMRQALKNYAVRLEELAEEEHDAGLGNGGLGRLAACFLDSCASLDYPVTGYGIRYDYGMFYQKIRNGYQEEHPEHWLERGYPWEFEAPEDKRIIKFNGRTEIYDDDDGRRRVRWLDTDDVLAFPYDVPVPGYRNDTVNTLRLWKSMATEEFNLNEFNAGSYTEAVAAKTQAEQISMVLYPNDASESGKALRLRQQYFLSSASLQDVLAHWVEAEGRNFANFASKHCFQLNDTHPAIAVPELMRLLMDVYSLTWDQAWSITSQTMAYTNHTLLPEALERWPTRLLAQMLPRLLEIINEINARFLRQVAQRWPGDGQKLRDMSIIEEGREPQVRMAYLAIVASFSVNGVAHLHTELLKKGLLRQFHELWPEKFNNKTNGVTPRRWLGFCNPELASLISETLNNDDWMTHLDALDGLRAFADQPDFQERWLAIKERNKQRVANLVKSACDLHFDTNMIFDVQVKRIHEYKRQLLNVLHIIHRYGRILRNDTGGMTPRCIIIGGKAAPGYVMAKLIIKLINNVADTINQDERCWPWLRVAFVPNYGVSIMETICAGADLSEQISTAGKEASGTGNMKFMMNGAVTIGTLDGANVEIVDAVGEDNFFLFGLKADEVEQLRQNYRPDDIIARDHDLSRVMSMLESGQFNLYEHGLFRPIIDSIRNPNDQWLTAADFRSYVDAQDQVDLQFRDKSRWARMSILNTACSGRFSSDRTIRDYAREIWKLD